jgi:hypothetical protein
MMQNPMPEYSETYGQYTVRVACASRDELGRLVGEDPYEPQLHRSSGRTWGA